MKRQIFLLIIYFGVCPFSFTQVHQNITAYQADSLINVFADSINFVILDVRTAGEYGGGFIEHAINLDYYNSGFDDSLKLKNRDLTYLIYCQGGGRSIQVFTKMNNMGFTKVYNLIGGISAWIGAGYSIVRDSGIEEYFQSEIVKVYPNPVDDLINVDFTNTGGVENCVVMDGLGRILLQTGAKGKERISLNVSMLPSGYYLVHTQLKDGISVHRIYIR